MTKNKTERTIECERLDGNTIIAHEGSCIVVLSANDFYRYLPRRVVLAGHRRGKALRRGITSQRREIARQWKELREASAPWGGLVAYEKRKNSEAVHS